MFTFSILTDSNKQMDYLLWGLKHGKKLEKSKLKGASLVRIVKKARVKLRS